MRTRELFAAGALLALLAPAGPPPAGAAVPTPGAPQEKPVAIVGATIHTLSGPDLPGGVLVFDRGRITAVGTTAEIPAGAERVDAAGLHVYPGLVDPYSILGLSEIDAVRATNDYAETGNVTPNVRAEVAVNPESEALPVTRANGVLTALVAPRGTLLRGTAAFMMLDGWTWADMTLAAPVALCLAWPSMVVGTPSRFNPVPEERQREVREQRLRELQQAFDDARAYWTAKRARGNAAVPAQDTDERWEAMIPVLEGKLPVIVEADEVQQIEAAVAFAARERIHIVLYGGYDAPRCAALLRQYDVPVIVRATLRLPARRYEGYDTQLCVPERLRAEGVRFCVANGGGFANERNLPYQAAAAMACGLPRDEALRAVTLYPARILGVDGRVGSLETGKDATLIVTDGDPLETPTQVKMAFLQGRKVDLDDKQKALWRKYEEKHRRYAEEQKATAGR